MYQPDPARYERMPYRRCGLSGLKLPLISLGLWHNFGDITPLRDQQALLRTAFDHGITHFDLANNYGPPYGEAERVLKEMGTHLLIHQPRYSLLARGAEEGLFDTLAREGVGCIAFSPLRGGVLTDKYLAGIPADSRAGHDPRYLKPEMLTEDLLDKVRALNEIAAGRGQTLAEMALSWVLRQPQVTSLLIGASKPEQIVRNCAVTDAPGFSDDELRRIDELTL